MGHNRVRILFFIGRLSSGGKERRLIELLTYLKSKDNYELMVVVTKDQVHYPDFYRLQIPYKVLPKRWAKKDISVFYTFYKVCNQFKPDLIHTWGRMQSFYTLPAVLGQKIPLINGQITAAPPLRKKWSFNSLIDKLNFRCSDLILSNSKAGVVSFAPPIHKTRVVYNGINLKRFENLPSIESVKAKYGIATPFSVLMASTFSPQKDYDTFFKVAELVTKMRDDITFIGVGASGGSDAIFQRMLLLSSSNSRIIFHGRSSEVEALMNAVDIGILFSNKAVHGEGISNSVIEFMSLSKPVIANDAGGTVEVVRHNVNGYLITNQTKNEIAKLIIGLIDDPQKRKLFGVASKRIINQMFSLQRMGEGFESIYSEVLRSKSLLNRPQASNSEPVRQ